jgi:hypothetical protein
MRAAPPDPLADHDPAYPLALLSLATDRAQASQWAVEPGDLVVTVHPGSACGLPDGAACRLESRHGARPAARPPLRMR